MSIENFILASNRDNKLVQNLAMLSQADGLSHAYLFHGEAKDEMKGQALALARKLELGEKIDIHKEPVLIDAIVFDAQEENSLGIDIVREVKNFLWQKPFKSIKRTVIILGAEELTRIAQNAILKILEDAPKSALIILVATSPERLLPTITSRLQKVYITGGTNAVASKKTDLDDRARLYVNRFVRADMAELRSLSKEIIDEEKEGATNLTIAFIDELISLLSKKPEQNSLFLKELLYRRRLIGEYSLNKRLQLAFLSNLWYNG